MFITIFKGGAMAETAQQNNNAQSRINSVLKENRRFVPPESFSRNAHIRSAEELAEISARAAENPMAFWEARAREIDWFEPWHTALEWEYPHAKWFVGGKLNISYNCLDRHLVKNGDKTAFIWEGEPGEIKKLSYRELHAEVCRLANALKKLGVKMGDVVGIYMGMNPEAAIAMLACARIGATHNVVFGGFSAEALHERMMDSKAVCIITQNAAQRRGETILLKPAVDEALMHTPNVKNVVVFKRTDIETSMQTGRDHWWHELLKSEP
ncbi:MAG TPA: AMP-binding protein, partial [Patescibacteria group bacterium]|nr:AMP-binding protein [Patescibacteria group bacterium]